METNKKVTYRVIGDEHVKLGEVSSNYEILQNREFLEIIKPIEETGLMKIETAGTIFNGAESWVLFEVNSIEPVPGDVYRMFLAAFNSFNNQAKKYAQNREYRVEYFQAERFYSDPFKTLYFGA